MDKKLLTRTIQNTYGINVANSSLLRKSSDNDVYLLKSSKNNKFVLRVSKRDIRQDVIFELTLIESLSEKGVPVADVVKTKNGELFTVVEGSVVVIFEYIDGFHINISPGKKPDLFFVGKAAQILAKLHNTSKQININLPRNRDIFTELEKALKIRKIFNDKFEAGKKFLEEIKTYMQWAKQNTNENYLIHNDYRPDNVFFKDHKIEAVVDFNWACRGPAIKDVAHALVEWSFPDGADGYWEDVFNTLLKSYNEKADTKIENNSMLYKWICFSCISDAATYFTDLANEGVYKKINSSYMYKKYSYFKKEPLKNF